MNQNTASINQSKSKFWTPDGLHHASLPRIWGFTMNNVATTVFLLMMNYITYFQTGFIGLTVMLAATLATVMRLWDGVTDPVIGFFIDKTNGRFGKNRPFMIIGCVGLIVSGYIMLYTSVLIPEGPVRVCFYIFIEAIFYIFFTFQNSITRCGQACLTNDPKERPRFAMFDGVNQLFLNALFLIMVSSYLVPKYSSMSNLALFHELWLICSIVCVIATIIAVIAIAPKDCTEFFGLAEEKQKVQRKDYIDIILHNRALQMLILAASSDKIATRCKSNGVVNIVLFGIIAGNYALAGGITMYTNIAACLFCFIGSGFFAAKFGQKKALIWGSVGALIFNLCGAALWFFGDATTLSLPGYEGFNGLTFFTIAFFAINILVFGFSSISSNIVLPMIADCADYEVYRSGKYLPGIMGTLFSLVDKSLSALSPTIVGLCFAAIGFRESLPDMNTTYSLPLKMMAIVIAFLIPSLGLVCNIIAMKFYPLSKEKMEEIQTEIAAIKAKGATA